MSRVHWTLRTAIGRVFTAYQLFVRRAARVTRSVGGMIASRRVCLTSTPSDLSLYVRPGGVGAVRDMLAVVNTLNGHPGARRADLYISSVTPPADLPEMFSALQLCDVPLEIGIHWLPDVESGLAPCDSGQVGLDRGLVAFTGRARLQAWSVDDFIACDRNVLKIPLSVEVWAKSMLKQYRPGALFACLSVWDKKSPRIREEARQEFYASLFNRFPLVHWFVLNTADAAGLDWEPTCPNVICTRTRGYSFLQELALVREADVFVGPYDRYCPVIAGTKKPFIVIGSDSPDSLQRGSASLSEGRRAGTQVWLEPGAAISQVADVFEQIHARILDGDPASCVVSSGPAN